jgi:hypothetical protein
MFENYLHECAGLRTQFGAYVNGVIPNVDVRGFKCRKDVRRRKFLPRC